jgi:hypothetical protein
MCANTSLAVHDRPHRSAVRRIERAIGTIAWFLHVTAEIWREWHGNEKCMRSLAALDDDDLPSLSEAGQALRREARRRLLAG